jgi:hypothetical protein
MQSGKKVPTFQRNLLSPSLHTSTIQRLAKDISVMLVPIYQTTWWHIPQGCNTKECTCINSFHLKGLLPEENIYIINFIYSSVSIVTRLRLHDQAISVLLSKAFRPALGPIHRPN